MSILMGDFNVDILQYDSVNSVSDFLDLMYSNSLIRYMTGPSRITRHSSLLIDTIFYNGVDEQVISGNLVTSLSDHLAQFFILPYNFPYYKYTTGILSTLSQKPK